MKEDQHVASLESRHQHLEATLRELSQHPSVPDAEISEIKREKLRLKDKIADLRSSNGVTH